MTGWQLKLWRRSLLWSRDRAAEELGVSLRTYKDYENAERVKRSVAMATVTLSLINVMPALKSDQLSKDLLLQMLQKMTAEVSGKETGSDSGR
ncbi:helix-turn-helix transcriptional regulator [Pantoea sp. DY-17]|uniref:helix-turn-helix transcriptional regulator n=1 Tax=Pantoea sp. DY-17 TaxID=2871490 RepID=UPI001C9767DC|nr:helix-turn-helix transcriptional regulator [Pantoea sp. DY-17]MBY4954593.1 helix-turn-helix domain-containing protein [Pantoea sp. DY-17]